MSLSAAVVPSEPKNDNPASGKSKTAISVRTVGPEYQIRQNRSGVLSPASRKKGTLATFPNQGHLTLAAAAKRFKRYALLVDKVNCFVVLCSYSAK